MTAVTVRFPAAVMSGLGHPASACNMNRLQTCPLCGSHATDLFHSEPARDYHCCSVCRLVFVPERFLLTPDREKAVYDLHRNSPDDQAYRSFLGRLFTPLQAMLKEGSEGLDFGSGPGPTLSIMFEEAGHDMSIYDCFYARDPAVFDRRYDFITATEVVEHLYAPGAELDRLWRCLRSGGLLGIMTKRVRNYQAFTTWHYKNDPTHVCFFSRTSFDWLADKWSADVNYPCGDVVIFTRQE